MSTDNLKTHAFLVFHPWVSQDVTSTEQIEPDVPSPFAAGMNALIVVLLENGRVFTGMVRDFTWTHTAADVPKGPRIVGWRRPGSYPDEQLKEELITQIQAPIIDLLRQAHSYLAKIELSSSERLQRASLDALVLKIEDVLEQRQ